MGRREGISYVDLEQVFRLMGGYWLKPCSVTAQISQKSFAVFRDSLKRFKISYQFDIDSI
jgi:hypothetical protein